MTQSLRIAITRLRQASGGFTHCIREAVGNTVREPLGNRHGPVRIRGDLAVGEPRKTLQAILDRLTAADGKLPRILPSEEVALGNMLGDFLRGGADYGDIDEMWIETDDPLIAGLPWALTRAPNGDSLAARGVPVAVSVGTVRDEAGLPDPAVMLIAAPEPIAEQFKLTEANDHIKELRQRLASCQILPDVPKTFVALQQALHDYSPDILYFFGHGTLCNEDGELDGQLRLVMQESDDPNDGHVLWPITELASFLDGNPDVRATPGLVYLNCCWSGVGGEFGGIQIGKCVPVLIANRTSAKISATREQAVRIMERILDHDVPPHEAVAKIVQEGRGAAWSYRIRAAMGEHWWMTPTVFASYRRWRSRMEPVRSNRLFTRHETLLLDRYDHWGRTESGLRYLSKPVLVLLWGGTEEDGLHALADRLHVELAATPYRVRRLFARPLEWPEEAPERLEYPELTLGRLIATRLEAAICDTPSSNPDALALRASSLLGSAGGIALLEFAAIPATVREENAAILVKACIDTLGDRLGSPLQGHTTAGKTRIIVFLRLARSEDRELPKAVEEICERYDHPMVVIRTLPPLKTVDHNDIVDLLDRWLESRSRPLFELRSVISREILVETEGRYEPTRSAIEDIEHFHLKSRR